jgi:hypothetical protein
MMAAKFTKGDSVKTTVTTAQKNPPPNVQAKSHSIKSGNTMSGMPGHIDAGASKDSGGMKGGKAFGPHRGGPIGEKGGSGAKSMGKADKAPGTTVKNYKSASTSAPGTLKGSAGKMEKLTARTSSEGRRKSCMY